VERVAGAGYPRPPTADASGDRPRPIGQARARREDCPVAVDDAEVVIISFLRIADLVKYDAFDQAADVCSFD